MNIRIPLLRTLDSLITSILTPVPRSRRQLGAVDLGEQVANEFRRLSGEVSAGLQARKKTEGELAAEIAALQARLQDVEQRASRRPGPVGASAGLVNVGDRIASALLASTQLEELRAGTLKTARIPIGSFRGAGKGPSAATTLTNTTANPFPERDPEIFGPIPRRVSVGDLIPSRTTTASAIQFLQASRSGLAAPQAVEGTAKSQIDLGVTLVTAPVVTVACWSSISRQALDDGGQLRDFVSSTLLDALEIGEDEAILNGDGAAGHMLGLLTQATAYSRPGTVPADMLRGAITQIALAGGMCDGIVLSPIGLEMLELEKDAQGRYLLQLTVDALGASRVWRVPCVSSLAMVGNAFLAADFSRAARLWNREQATVVVSLEHSDYFVRNLAAVLAEEREALTVPRPALLVKGSFP